MLCVWVALAQGPGRAGSAKCCWASFRSTGWIPAVLLDASAPVELPAQLAVLAVTDQLGIPLLRWWGCGLKGAVYRQH